MERVGWKSFAGRCTGAWFILVAGVVLLLPGCPPLSQQVLTVQFQDLQVSGSQAVAQLVLDSNTYQPTALLMTLEYDPAEMRVSAVLAGAAAQSAGKVVDWGITAGGSTTISVVGLNETEIPAGTLAEVHFEAVSADGEPVALGGFLATAANVLLEDYAEVCANPLSIPFESVALPGLLVPGLIVLVVALCVLAWRRTRWAGAGLLLLVLACGVLLGRAHGESAVPPPADRDLGSLVSGVKIMLQEYQTAQEVGGPPVEEERGAPARESLSAPEKTAKLSEPEEEEETTVSFDFNGSGIVDQRDLAFFMDNFLGRDATMALNPANMPAWWLQLAASLIMRVPVVSEMAPACATGPADEDGDHPAWIEVYNHTDQTMDLTGFELSAGESVWMFPETYLSARSHRMVFLSGKNRSSGPCLHTNFAPAPNQAFTVTLYAPDGETFCASVTMPVMTEGHSWKYAPFEYADTVTPYAARTCVLPLLLPMMREAMALYTSLETLAETASLYSGTTTLLSSGGDCESEYCESDAPTPGAY
ncbi:MAG TPA: lamin tail domain-containing protein [Candidatus Hydrogenedentes bacterium]|nr:lamin tail domain-containing protein [Candidatus Hydrogenedentota bacterium]